MKQRIFLAINLPKQVKKEIADIQVKLKKFDWPVRWEPVDKCHLTLRFLGYLTDAEIKQVEEIVKQAISRVPPFSLNINGFVVFPSLKAPRVFCLKIEDNPQLFALQKSMAQAIDEKEIGEFERHLFSGHITIGRMTPVSVNFRALTQMEFKSSFAVKSVEIMKSVLKRTGSEYKVVETYNLR